MRTIGCRITVINTGLYCEVELGVRTGKEPQFWAKTKNKMARLGILSNGVWGYIMNASDKIVGLTILPPSPASEDPDGNQTYHPIADLNDVPEDFLKRVTCGNYLNGSGLWALTKEAVKWEFFSPCI